MLHIIIYMLHLCAHEMDGCKYEDAVYYCTLVAELSCVCWYSICSVLVVCCSDKTIDKRQASQCTALH